MARTKCAVKMTKKYIVASLRIVPSKPGAPGSRRIPHRAGRRSITKNTDKSSKKGIGVTVWRRGKFEKSYHMLAKS